MTALMCLFGAGSLLWPADLDRERIALVQLLCLRAMTFFGLIAAAFLAGASLPGDLTSKRIYSIASKPVSRLELLLGKAFGLLLVVLLFTAAGGVITYVVTRVASARRTYAGGSYTLEVTTPTAEIRTDGEPVTVTRGQLLTADEQVDDGFAVTVAGRTQSVSGTIPASAVQLRERTLSVERTIEPTGVTSRCTGRPSVVRGALGLACGQVAVGDTWHFDLTGLALPGEGDDVPVRLGFRSLVYEPTLKRDEEPVPPRVTFRFRNPASGQEVTEELEFAWVERGSDGPQQSPHYQEALGLPRALLADGKLEASVLGIAPAYPKVGRAIVRQARSPTWHFRGLGAGLLPDGQQTLRVKLLVNYGRALQLIDHIGLTFVITNPASGRSRAYPVTVRNKTETFVRFPPELVDEREGVDVTVRGVRDPHSFAYAAGEAPLRLMRRPGWFSASLARSVFLVFLQLAVFTVLATAVSAVVSAPVAVLFVLVIALAGAARGVFETGRPSEQVASAALAHTMQLVGIAGLAVGLAIAILLAARRAVTRILLLVAAAAVLTYLGIGTRVSGSALLLLALGISVAVAALARPGGRRGLALGVLGAVLAALLGVTGWTFFEQVFKGAATPQQALEVLLALAPGTAEFGTASFIARGAAVPWAFVMDGLRYAVVYMVISFGVGYALFRSREFQ